MARLKAPGSGMDVSLSHAGYAGSKSDVDPPQMPTFDEVFFVKSYGLPRIS